ncbi:hypothetical protein B0H10DRAFT_1765176, partial [Mycena sp. CBHHK59/15]
NCRRHTSVYTCLLRGTTADGTVIVKAPNSWGTITGGLPGWMRQEFCELDLLDEITALRYEGQLPNHVTGDVRNTIIRGFQTWKGDSYMPADWHQALRWKANEVRIQLLEIEGLWMGEIKNERPRKRTRGHEPADDVGPTKKQKGATQPENHSTGPRGLIWDDRNYSCGYDTLFTILLNIWTENGIKWQ